VQRGPERYLERLTETLFRDKKVLGSALKRNAQPELDLSRRAQRVDPRSDAGAIYIVAHPCGPINRFRSDKALQGPKRIILAGVSCMTRSKVYTLIV